MWSRASPAPTRPKRIWDSRPWRNRATSASSVPALPKPGPARVALWANEIERLNNASVRNCGLDVRPVEQGLESPAVGALLGRLSECPLAARPASTLPQQFADAQRSASGLIYGLEQVVAGVKLLADGFALLGRLPTSIERNNEKTVACAALLDKAEELDVHDLSIREVAASLLMIGDDTLLPAPQDSTNAYEDLMHLEDKVRKTLGRARALLESLRGQRSPKPEQDSG